MGVRLVDRAIHGSFGKVYIDGLWEANFNGLEAKVEMEKIPLKLAGDPWTRHKRGNLKGTFTITGLKMTSKMIQKGFDDFEIISKLDDPEAYGHERIRLKNCIVDNLGLAGWKAGEIVEEEIPGTFEEYELLDPIEED